MAIQIADGFQLRVAKPLDDRQNVETIAQLDPTYGYEGQIVYVKDIKQFYICYKDENGSLAYKVMETGSSTPNESAGIELWVSGESYEENDFVSYNDYIYRCKIANNDTDFVEDNWKQLTYGINELSKEDVEGLLGLTEEEIETMANLIADTEVRLDKTYSSSKIYQDIQKCLNDSKTFTLSELGKFSGIGYKIVTSTSEMTSKSIIYLLANENTYDMYVVEENGATTKIGDMNVNLDNYYTKTEIDNDFLKKADADGKYATITTVDEKADKSYVDDNFATMDKVVGGVAKYEMNEHSTGAGSTSGIDIVTLPKGHKYIVVAHFQINKTITDVINMNGSVVSNGVGVTVRYMPHNGGGAEATLLIDATNENAVIRCYSHNPTSEDLYFQYTVQVMTLA